MLRHLYHHRRISTLALAAGASALVLASCAPATTDSNAGSSSASPKAGGTLDYRVAADPTCVDPHQARLRAALGVLRNTVDSLTFQTSDGTIEPWLAESWQISPNATRYTFKIREGVTFSDGSPLTSEVVAANLKAIQSMGASASIAGPYLNDATSIEAIDPTTVVLDFSSPQAQFLQASSTPSMGIVAPSTLQLSLGERCTKGPIGTGPFIMESYVPNQGITLTRRSGYQWAPASFENSGDAYLEAINVAFVPDPSVGAGALISGQFDAMADVSTDDYPRLEDAGMMLLTRPNPGIGLSFFLNARRGPLAEQGVRYAVLHGIDTATLLETMNSSVNRPATCVLSEVTPGYMDHSSLLTYDQAEAAAALDEAGWKMGAGGIREKDGRALSLQINYMVPSTTHWVPFLELAQQSYSELGIRVTLNPVTATEDADLLAKGQYDVRFNGLSRGDPDVLRGVFSGLDPELDAALTSQAGIGDPVERTEAVGQATRLILERAYAVPIAGLVLGQAWSPAVKGLIFDNTNTPQFNSVWLDE